MNKILILFTMAFVMIACSKEASFDDIYNGVGENVLLPTKIDGVDAILSNGLHEDKYTILIQNVFYMIYEDEDFYRDIAMIINNESQLSSCINHRGEVCEWPQIDFDKQSLVLAQCRVNKKGNDYASRLVIDNKQNPPVLHVEVKSQPPVTGNDYLSIPGAIYVAALFPKISESEIDISVWKRDYPR